MELDRPWALGLEREGQWGELVAPPFLADAPLADGVGMGAGARARRYEAAYRIAEASLPRLHLTQLPHDGGSSSSDASQGDEGGNGGDESVRLPFYRLSASDPEDGSQLWTRDLSERQTISSVCDFLFIKSFFFRSLPLAIYYVFCSINLKKVSIY